MLYALLTALGLGLAMAAVRCNEPMQPGDPASPPVPPPEARVLPEA